MSYGTFTKEHLIKLEPGLVLFNQQEYWECHEVLEDPWFEDPSDNARLIFWAVIQVAASLVHVQNEKVIGANGMLKKAKDKMRRASELGVETDLLTKYASWDKLKALVFGIPENAPLESFQELYNFRFNDFPFGTFEKEDSK